MPINFSSICLGSAAPSSGGVSIKKIIVKSDTIPTAAKKYEGAVYQYVGTTTATYTHGYIYECVSSQSYLARATFEPHDFVFDELNYSLTNFFSEITDDYLQIKSGRFKYLQAGDVWNINGLDENGDTVFSDYQLYTQDLVDSGFTFIVPIEDISDGDEVSYEVTFHEQTNYSWERIDVQPGATRGRFLALWNCETGLAESNPPSSPFPYATGDYFIVGNVGTTNYKPSGSEYVIGTASTTVETGDVAVDDTYYYDGTNWRLQKNDTSIYQTKSNLVTSISSLSTDTQYPSAKCVYDIVGDIETVLHNINSGS